MSEIRKVTVTDCSPARRGDGTIIEGEGQYGPWTLYEVMATDDTGTPIQEKIKCFKSLPLGEQQLEFNTEHDEKWGTSHTVKPLKGAKPGPARDWSNDAVEMVRESVQLLSDRVRACEAALQRAGLLAIPGSDIPTVVPPAVPVGAASVQDDDSIPF